MVRSEWIRGSSERLWIALLGLLVVLLPVSVELSVIASGGGRPPSSIRVPIADVLLWLTLTVALATRRLNVGVSRLIHPPALAVALIGLATTVPQLSGGASWVECLQRIDYFLVAYLVAMAAPPHALWRTLGSTLIAVTGVFLLVGIVQVAIGEPPWRVTSVFEDRHLFGGWVAIASATLTARGPFPGWGRRAGAIAFLVAALVTATTLLPLMGIAVGAGVTCWTRDRWRGLGTTVLVVLSAVIVLAALTPSAHLGRSLEDWSLRDVASLEELRLRGAEIDGLRANLELASLRRGDWTIRISSPNWHPPSHPPPDLRREAAFEPHYLRQRYLEWQAALNAAGENPVLGHGLGSYQTHVSGNYRTFKKLKTLEPNTQCAYAVELVSTGLVGVTALTWFLLVGVLHTRDRSESGDRRATHAGLLTAATLGLAIPIWTCFLAVVVVLLVAQANRSASSVAEG